MSLSVPQKSTGLTASFTLLQKKFKIKQMAKKCNALSQEAQDGCCKWNEIYIYLFFFLRLYTSCLAGGGVGGEGERGPL